jgi:GNAT superfamily N-acetyltransferase
MHVDVIALARGMMEGNVQFRDDLTGIDWAALKHDLAADAFDNGRSPEALRRSFEASALVAIAWQDGRVVGTARALTDGVCNACIIDVWTRADLRRRGIARRMMQKLMARLKGQHVALFSSDAEAFYRELEFKNEAGGLSKVVGRWLEQDH